MTARQALQHLRTVTNRHLKLKQETYCEQGLHKVKTSYTLYIGYLLEGMMIISGNSIQDCYNKAVDYLKVYDSTNNKT